MTELPVPVNLNSRPVATLCHAAKAAVDLRPKISRAWVGQAASARREARALSRGTAAILTFGSLAAGPWERHGRQERAAWFKEAAQASAIPPAGYPDTPVPQKAGLPWASRCRHSGLGWARRAAAAVRRTRLGVPFPRAPSCQWPRPPPGRGLPQSGQGRNPHWHSAPGSDMPRRSSRSSLPLSGNGAQWRASSLALAGCCR